MDLNLMKYKYLYFSFSLFLISCSLFSLFFWGLKPSIDFSGGSILEIKNEKLKINDDKEKSKIEAIVKNQGIELFSLQETNEGSYLFKTKEIDTYKKNNLIESLKNEFGEIEEMRFESVGPSIGKEMIKKTFIAIFLATAFIMFYVAWRFQDKKFGFCAILAMVHDSLILLGSFSFLGKFWGAEVDTLFVTAVLTILSFSVHDTIVVYDRIRESLKKFPEENFETLVNKAVVETITRSLNNSLTIIFMLLCLFLLGGTSIKWFSLSLLIGTIIGTYSSTFLAAPLLIVWEKAANFYQKKKNY